MSTPSNSDQNPSVPDPRQALVAYVTAVSEIVHRWRIGQIPAENAMQMLDQMGKRGGVSGDTGQVPSQGGDVQG